MVSAAVVEPFDQPPIQCWQQTGCCVVSPCAIGEDDFLCAVKALLPEGPVFNISQPAQSATGSRAPAGGIAVGCAKLGCQQLVSGECCDDALTCEDAPDYPQIGVIDAYGASAYQVIAALCAALKEFDPCSAEVTLQRWLARFGIPTHRGCDPPWPDYVLSQLLCWIVRINAGFILNAANLAIIAEEFGATVIVNIPGDLNCNPLQGMWFLARDAARQQCPPTDICDPDSPAYIERPLMGLQWSCAMASLPVDLIICAGPITTHPNCILDGAAPLPVTKPHDPVLYEAFKIMLPSMFPAHLDVCVLDCADLDCYVAPTVGHA